MIFTCTSKGNTLPNGLFSGSTDPRQSMMTAPSMNVASPLCSTLIICSLDQSPTRARTWGFKPKKVYPWGVPPRVSSRVQSPPRDVSPPISSSRWFSKSRCALRVGSFHFVQCCCSRWWARCSPLCCTPYQSPCCSKCWRFSITSRWVTNVSAPSSDAAPMRNWGIGPKRCRGTTLSPGN